VRPTHHSENQVLAEKPDGEKVAWKNPNTGNEFEVTPTNTYKNRLGVCRDYEIVATIGGQREVSDNRTCRQPGGYWESVGN
jgi:surface antigen